MSYYNMAFDISAKWGYQNQNCNKIDNHEATYYAIRRAIPELPSYLVEGARDYACEALKMIDLKKLPKRSPRSPIRYHRKAAGVFLESGYINISTIEGRQRIPFILPTYFEKYSSWTIRSSNLIYVKSTKSFNLCVTVESSDQIEKYNGPVMGVDRGINNVAVTSANQFFNSKAINKIRGKYAYLRKQLQSKGTRSAKRKLKKLSGRERRFKAGINHKIAKEIVNTPYGVFALENLKGVFENRMEKKKGSARARMRNEKLNSWSFFQLEKILRYKAEELGKMVILVDGWNTSKTCSSCGHVSKRNRQGKNFHCRKCGYQLHSDLNASRNIARLGITELSRLSVNQPNVAPNDTTKIVCGGQLQASKKWSG